MSQALQQCGAYFLQDDWRNVETGFERNSDTIMRWG